MGERPLVRVLSVAGVAYGVLRRLRESGPEPAAGAATLQPAAVWDAAPLPDPAVKSGAPVTRYRLLLGAAGVVGIAYGAVRMLTQPEQSHPITLFVWLAVAVVVHDGVLAPLTLLVGALLALVVPSRARRYLQGTLVSAALVTAVTLPLIYRRGSVPAIKALESQNYLAHLAIVVAIIAAGGASAYAADVVRGHRTATRRKAGRSGRG